MLRLSPSPIKFDHFHLKCIIPLSRQCLGSLNIWLGLTHFIPQNEALVLPHRPQNEALVLPHHPQNEALVLPHCPQNEALVPGTRLLLSSKTPPDCNRFQKELPSDEGREPYHFLWHCFDVQIGENVLASQRNISFLKYWIIYFSWMMTAGIRLLTRTMDGWSDSE